jgi:hypothetical protein
MGLIERAIHEYPLVGSLYFLFLVSVIGGAAQSLFGGARRTPS